MYNNHLWSDQALSGVESSTRRRVLAGTSLDSIIERKVVILREFNAHSTEWNLHCRERRDMAGLETLVKKHDLILNKEPAVATRPTRNSRISIINLTFKTPDMGNECMGH